MDDRWSEVDHYLGQLLAPTDSILDAALSASGAAGLPAIQVSHLQGSLLHLLARSVRATSILEIGTLGGYSTIWLARALPPEGRLITLEIDPRHAAVARGNLERAGLSASVDVRVGPALATLGAGPAPGFGPFDFTFIDADKESSAEYFDHVVRLSRPGALIVVDNIVREGAIVDGRSRDPRVQGIRRLLEAMARDPRVRTSAVQTVGAKKYDGWAIALVDPRPSVPIDARR